VIKGRRRYVALSKVSVVVDHSLRRCYPSSVLPVEGPCVAGSIKSRLLAMTALWEEAETHIHCWLLGCSEPGLVGYADRLVRGEDEARVNLLMDGGVICDE